MIARHARRDPAAVRAALDLPAGRPLALVSFGGHGTSRFRFSSLDCLDLAGVVFTSGMSGPAGGTPAGVFEVAEARMYALGLRYEDLVGAVDVVVTKPGYGILGECIANRTAMLYTSRGRFAEYESLVEAMPRYLRCQHLDQDALFAGRWRDALAALLDRPDPPETLPTNGAEVAAERMLGMIG
jgi:L-arabinokinase